jgi:hypothetical protein
VEDNIAHDLNEAGLSSDQRSFFESWTTKFCIDESGEVKVSNSTIADKKQSQ